MEQKLLGKVAIVTGIGSGIGQECALTLARRGAHVFGCDIDVTLAQKTLSLAEQERLSFSILAPADMTNPEAVQSAVDEAVRQYGGIDIVVNAAAFCVFAYIEEMSITDWRRTLAGELDIVFLMCKTVWPHLMARQGGSIINFSSVNSYSSHPAEGALAHCAGKGGVLAMTRQLAKEGGPHNIRANSISPGLIETGATRDKLQDPEFKKAILGELLLKRIGTPYDIAACGFLSV